MVYTTNSHMGTDTFVLEGSYNQFCKKNKLPQDGINRETMIQFLIKERKWLPEIAETIELPEDGATHPEEGKGYLLNSCRDAKVQNHLSFGRAFRHR